MSNPLKSIGSAIKKVVSGVKKFVKKYKTVIIIAAVVAAVVFTGGAAAPAVAGAAGGGGAATATGVAAAGGGASAIAGAGAVSMTEGAMLAGATMAPTGAVATTGLGAGMIAGGTAAGSVPVATGLTSGLGAGGYASVGGQVVSSSVPESVHVARAAANAATQAGDIPISQATPQIQGDVMTKAVEVGQVSPEQASQIGSDMGMQPQEIANATKPTEWSNVADPSKGADKGWIRNTWDKGVDMAEKADDWMQENPLMTKIGGKVVQFGANALQNMLAAPPEEQERMIAATEGGSASRASTKYIMIPRGQGVAHSGGGGGGSGYGQTTGAFGKAPGEQTKGTQTALGNFINAGSGVQVASSTGAQVNPYGQRTPAGMLPYEQRMGEGGKA